MQKQIILSKVLPDKQTKAKYEATAKIVEIGGVSHLICDLYKYNTKLARYVINDKEYGKYLYFKNKWSKDLRWYSEAKFEGEYETSILGKVSVSPSTAQVFEQFGIHKDCKNSTYIELMLNEMRAIAHDNQQIREKDRQEERQRLFAMLPKVPEEFKKWAEELFNNVPLSLIYKRETKFRAVVGCCKCGQTVTVKTNSVSPNTKTIPVPRVGEIGKCQWCHKYGKYMAQGRYKNNSIEKNCYLFQKLSDGGLAIRYFELRLKEYMTGHNIDLIERARVFINIKTKAKTYWNHAWYGAEREYWHDYNARGIGSYHLGKGVIYPTYESEIRESSLVYADYKGYAYAATHINRGPDTDDYIDALCAYAYFPKIEYLYKAGYERIVRHLVNTHGITSLLDKKAKTIPDLLKIKSGRIHYFKYKNCELSYLEVLQFEKKYNLNLSNEEIEWINDMSRYYKFYDELKTVSAYMSVRKIYNRVKQYAEREYKGSMHNTWLEFKDYIIIRKELGYDMSNTVYLHPHSLKQAHAGMVAERESRRNEEHIALKMKEYDNIPKHYPKLKRRYGIISNGYVFIPAKSAKEIIIEGRSLHHCVGGDTYLKKHNKGETAIIFMRDIMLQDVPYVTIEVKDRVILQWYGAHDKKPTDDATLKAINDFEKHIKVNKKRNGKTGTTIDYLQAEAV